MPIAVIYIAVGLLFLGASPMPYGYYMLLRLVAFCVFSWAAFVAHKNKHETLPWVYGVLALLFNPIIKIYLPKELWASVDIASGVFLFFTRSYIRDKSHGSA